MAVWCSVLQCVAVCCSVLQCVAACCSVVQCGAVCSTWRFAQADLDSVRGSDVVVPDFKFHVSYV